MTRPALPPFDTLPAEAVRAWLEAVQHDPGLLAAALAVLAEDPRAGVRRHARRWARRLEAAARERRRLEALGVFDDEARATGHARVAGVDEVGRGPLAGPVVAAAVILPPGWIPQGLDDSKALSARRRLELYHAVCHGALGVAAGVVGVAAIDRHGIHWASLEAMRRAVVRLRPAADFVLVDGPHPVPGLGLPQRPIVDGDARSASVAAASVVAKTVRDRLCHHLDRAFPGYGLDRHKGYATGPHLAALARLGPAPVHRRRFLRRLEHPDYPAASSRSSTR